MAIANLTEIYKYSDQLKETIGRYESKGSKERAPGSGGDTTEA